MSDWESRMSSVKSDIANPKSEIALWFHLNFPFFKVQTIFIHRVDLDKRCGCFVFNPFYQRATFLLFDRGQRNFVVIGQQIGFVRRCFQQQFDDTVIFFTRWQRNFNRFANRVDLH